MEATRVMKPGYSQAPLPNQTGHNFEEIWSKAVQHPAVLAAAALRADPRQPQGAKDSCTRCIYSKQSIL